AITDTLREKYFSVENAKKTSALQMIKVDDIHPYAAIYISLLQKIPQRIMLGKNRKIRFLATTEKMIEYATNMLLLQDVERIAMICLDERKRVINTQFIAKGEESYANTSPSQIMQIITIYKPKYVIIAHNHICESLEPSHSDVSFTINTRKLIGKLGVELLDHIIVNKSGALSMAGNTNFSFIFNQ
ncbi:JAB domain-containing protein, partial [uncultured Eubacterium sp.]|uniref:JAB domain-containing protein n=1 Tax=uncultured Eubacterium sp. TaxID=165185 RepID=UPI0015BCF369